MKSKYSRYSAIRVIIAGQRIASQDELLQQLLALGYECTQATLSRDLKARYIPTRKSPMACR